MKTVKIILHVETLTRQDFCRDCQDASRLLRFVKMHWDFRDLSRCSRDLSRRCQDLSRNLDIVEAFWVWKWWKVLTDWEISTRKYKNPRTSQSRSRQTVKKRQNFQISMKFSILIKIFWSGHWCRDKIETYFLTLSRFSWLSRLTLWQLRDRESRLRPRRDKSRPPRLLQTKVNQTGMKLDD